MISIYLGQQCVKPHCYSMAADNPCPPMEQFVLSTA